MRFLDSRAMAFAVESMELRILVFSGKKIESWHRVPLKPNTVREGTISRPDGVGEVMAEAIKENSIPTRRVLAAVPSAGASAQILTLPPVKRGNLKTIIDMELKRTMGEAQPTSLLYWQMMPGDRFETQKRVYVISVPRSTIMPFVDACRAGGVGLKGIELKPFALARAVNCRTGVIVHADMDNIEIVVVDQHFPGLFRSVPVKDPNPSYQAATQHLLRELPSTIDFYNRTYRDSQLSPDAPIFLSGGLAQEPGVAEETARLTGGEVMGVEKPVDFPEDFPPGLFLTTLGLMLRKKW